MKEIHGDRQVTANQFIKEREYWIKQFSGEWSTGAFPYDYREGGPPRTGGETIDLPIPPGLTGALAKVTRGSDPRLHIVLTAGLAVLLRKYTRDNAATLGTTIDKQDAGGAGTAQFTNTVLALRCPVSDPMTFKEVILGVRQTIVEAIENQNYPIEALLNQLNLETNPETTPPGFPLFDVALLLENLHDRTYLGHINPGLIFSFLRTDEGEGGGMAISGTLEYNPALYTEGTVRRIGRHFTCLLARLLSDMDRPNAGIPLLTDDEQKELIHDFNATRAPYPGEKTIHQLFGEQAQRTPEAVAVRTFNAVDTDAGPGLTYRELDEESDRLAARLRDEGLCPGTIVAVHAGRRPGTIIAILGVLKAGAAYLPIDPAYPDQRIEYMLADSGAAVMVDGDNALRTTGVAAAGVANAAAYVLYTSGSTGRPRGVLVEHRALTAYIWWVAELLGSGGGKIKPLNLPLYTSVGFDLTVTSIFTPLVTGGSVVVYGGGEGGGDEDKEALIRRVMGNPDLDAVKLTPSHLKLLRARGLPDNAPDHLIVGGENLERDLVEEIYATPGKKPFIHNEYGPTEAVVGCMVHRFDPRQDKGKSVPLGVPAANTRIYLLDPHGQPVPPGVGGEIYIAGDGLARGYLNDPGATARCFVADPFFKGERMYRSGDLAVRHGDGSIEFLGRIDHQVKIRGHRVETGEIGARLREADGVADALVIAGTRRDGTNYLGAYLVPVPANRWIPPGSGNSSTATYRITWFRILSCLWMPFPSPPTARSIMTPCPNPKA